MKVLVCGAHGFVGRSVCSALQQSGYEVVEGVRHTTQMQPRGAVQRQVDFANWLSPSDWSAALEDVNAVVNAVGVLRGSMRIPIHHVHALAPIALYEACVQRGVRRVIHVSALGIERNASPYAQSKRYAEQALMRWNDESALDAVILRPSIVFGRGGKSSELFMRMAQWPLHILPLQAKYTLVQPVSVNDLADGVAALMASTASDSEIRGCLDICGPQALTLAELINSLRVQMGKSSGRQLFLPLTLTRWSATLADLVPVTPWGRQTLELLCHDNTGDNRVMRQLLGRGLLAPDVLVDQVWKQEG